MYYIRGILRNRLEYCVDWECLDLLRAAHDENASLDYLTRLAKDARFWSQWKRWMGEVIAELRADNEYPGWREDPDMAARRGAALGLEAKTGESLAAFVARIDRALEGKADQ